MLLEVLGILVLFSGHGNSQQLKLGLVANTHLGKNPTGGPLPSNGNPSISDLIDGSSGGRTRELCCCSPTPKCPVVSSGSDDYFDYDDDKDLVGSGIINPRSKEVDVGLRIANNPPSSAHTASGPPCPRGQTKCCYSNVQSLAHLGNRCLSVQQEFFKQSCPTNVPRGGKRCGTRSFNHIAGRKRGQSSPDEFPWTCLLLNQDNDFLGTCVIIPERFSNDMSRPTRKILTAAHKLSKLGQKDLLKVRVQEYDASGFNPPERHRHDEYTVVKFVTHPGFNPKRLNNDVAVLTVDRPIDMSRHGVNAACLPSCLDMFGNTFRNGTGARCWVAGWGKDTTDGSFKFIQNKVDVPLVNHRRCESLLRPALAKRSQSVARSFRLHDSEMCAGGEAGKDACDGDGGAPLVCQSTEGLWHVVGLVTWGVGCANRDVPGVYAKVSYFKGWIESN